MAKRSFSTDPQREKIKLLQARLRDSPQPRDGTLPSGAELETLEKKWLPAGSFVCRGQKQDCHPSSCYNRCTAEYWLEHSETVASLMRNLASHMADDPDLFYAAGKVHDLDYVKAPHDLDSKALCDIHPVPLVLDLMDMGAPPILSLAVLEHSPHLGLEPSSRLSDALIACDDAVTLSSTGYNLSQRTDLPAEILKLLASVPRGMISGTYRKGMSGRMVRAFNFINSRDYFFS